MTRTPHPAPDAGTIVLLIVLAAIWGGSFFFAEIALRELPPLTLTLFRVTLAVPVLALALRLRGIRLSRDPRVWRAYLVMGALNNAIPFSLIFWGQTRIDSGLASILNATTAVFAAVAAGLLLRDEALTLRRLAGAGLGLAGVTVIVGAGSILESGGAATGKIAVLAAAVSYALAGVWGRHALSKEPPLANALGMLAGSALLMAPAAIAMDGLPVPALAPQTWAAILGLAILSTALAFILYFAILVRAGAANLLLVTLLIPPFAILLGAVFLGERLGASAWSGFALIALGLAVTDGRILDRIRSAARRMPIA